MADGNLQEFPGSANTPDEIQYLLRLKVRVIDEVRHKLSALLASCELPLTSQDSWTNPPTPAWPKMRYANNSRSNRNLSLRQRIEHRWRLVDPSNPLTYIWLPVYEADVIPAVPWASANKILKLSHTGFCGVWRHWIGFVRFSQLARHFISFLWLLI
jgi:hypothetical protein